MGWYLKQYEIVIHPASLKAMNITLLMYLQHWRKITVLLEVLI